ncbi:hypothetical protein F5Y17DRAFT_472764 [Xylariaceae sp. FL0594]|nr:hypothetical protein F5Y17DRAFT_472764 [Xylariaceae sp. FL0594]
MELAGLGIGVAGLVGLFSTCRDIVEKWDSYKEYGVESASLVARLAADRAWFHQWGQSVGISEPEGKGSNRHEALSEPSTREAVDVVLQSIQKLDQAHFRRDLRSQAPSRASKLMWALRGKERLALLVASFESLVQRLYNLVPPASTTNIDPRVLGDRHIASNGNPTTEDIDIHKILNDIQNQLNYETRKALRDWLDAADTRQAFDDFAHRRLDGTCDWILNRPESMQWKSSPNHPSSTLWVNGPAGYEKTILSARLVEVLSAEPDVTLTYCFFSSEGGSRMNPFSVIRSWISHLIAQSQPVFEKLFSAIVRQIPGCIFLVDGLDECATSDGSTAHGSGSLRDFVEYITNTVSQSKCRLLIVSRNDGRIREGLRMDDTKTAGHLLELKISPADVKADAGLLSRNIVDRKLANKSDAQREELAASLVSRCDSMLLGIKLVEDDLRGGKNMKQLRRTIDEFSNKLDRIYERNWERILCRDDSSKRRAFAILRWTALSLRPLTVCELTGCLLYEVDESDEVDHEELPDAIDEVYIRTELLELCESLVEIRSGSARDTGDFTLDLIHFSAREYVLCHLPLPPGALAANSRLVASTESIQNNLLAITCLKYFNWGQPRPGEGNRIIASFLAYAKRYWYQHIKRGVENSQDVICLVNRLFLPSNTAWKWWVRYCSESLMKAGYELRHSETDDDDDDEEKDEEDEEEVDGGAHELINPLACASLIGLSETVDYLVAFETATT